MKTLLVAAIVFSSITTYAHKVEGVLILKGTLKTEVKLPGTKAKCKVKIGKTKNTLTEDKFGNPAYKVEIHVDFSAKSPRTKKEVEIDKTILMTNLFEDGVRDLEYTGEGIVLKIDKDGYLDNVSIPTHEFGMVVCKFE